jgi:ornithine carbamoyltransferase
VVYTDVWASMGQEKEAQERAKDFRGFQVNAKLMSHAKPDATILHCLPAHYGEEIDYATTRAPGSAVFDEAENRLHAQKALMVLLAG